MQAEKNRAGLVLALIGLAVLWLGRPARAVDPGPLERHIRGLKASIVRLSHKSFVRKLGNGQVEKFRVSSEGYSYMLVGRDGNKIVEWGRKGSRRVSYETWYAYPQARERLLEDERSVSYTSYYRNGQKWEQYTLNKEKKLKSYYVYDRKGKLVQ